MLNIDGQPHNADWTKQSWDLPPYRSEKFMKQLERMDMTLEQFRKLPVYRHAVRKGLIDEEEDSWIG
ncbi:MAG: hypothetical protein ACQEQG_07095 [Bacillota bacterium]